MAANNRYKKDKPAMSTGFGESKIHAAPEGTFAPDNWDSLTVNGGPIPEHLRGVITYAMTDQGKAEEEEAIEARGGRSAVEFARDIDDKKIDQYGDQLAGGLVMTQDPLATLMKRHTPAGHRGRFLGRAKTNHAGLVRGVVEYEPVLIDDGAGGRKRVEQGGMFLASIPEGVARQAERHYADLAKEAQVTAAEKVMEQNDQIISEEKLTRAARRRGMLSDLVGEDREDPAQVEAELARDFATA